MEHLYTRDLLASLFAGRPAPAPPSELSWERVHRLWSHHRLLPLLYPRLLEIPGVPRDVQAAMGAESRSLRVRTGLLHLELVRILPAVRDAAPQALLLKGPALAALYPRPDQRAFADLDFLVPRDAVEPAMKALEPFGYRETASAPKRRFYRLHHHHLVLRNPAGIVVELHWDLSRPSDYVRFDLKEVWAASSETRTDGDLVRTLAPHHQLLQVAHQALRRGFRELLRLVDAAFLLKRGAGNSELARNAVAWGLGPALWVLLMLTETWTGQKALPEIQERLPASPLLRRMVQALRPYPNDGRPITDKHAVRILCAPDRKSRLREMARFLSPAESQWLEMGYRAGEAPPWVQRVLIRSRRCVRMARWIWQWARFRRPLPEGP